MNPTIADKSESIAALCREYGVTRLELFGSAARETDFNPQTSDFDFLVEFGAPHSKSALTQFFGLAGELEALLGRHVDLVEAGSVKNPYLKESMDRSRVLIYQL